MGYNSIRSLRQGFLRRNGTDADVAQQVERVLGKDEVTGSNPVISSSERRKSSKGFLLFFVIHPVGKGVKKGMAFEMYFEEAGEGFPLVLLHGNGESHEYFVHQIAFFKQNFHIFALDTRGHGRSPRGDGEFSIARFADDLLDFLDGHGIAKAHLLGFSDGGNIALTFALRHPKRVEKLVLNGANIDPSGVRRSVQAPIEIGYAMARRFAARSEKARANAEMLGLMVNEPHIAPEELKKLDLPVLVIAGTKDMIRREHTELIARSLPRAQLVFLKGDHFIANREPEAFNRAVSAFLAAP